MKTAKKGEWVQIHEIILKSEQRTAKLPEDTMRVPVELWVKGFINHDAEIGQEAEITTLTGRITKGTLTEVNPTYDYGFGEQFVPELLKVGLQLKAILREGSVE
jgi:hypothetical protein